MKNTVNKIIPATKLTKKLKSFIYTNKGCIVIDLFKILYKKRYSTHNRN